MLPRNVLKALSANGVKNIQVELDWHGFDSAVAAGNALHVRQPNGCLFFTVRIKDGQTFFGRLNKSFILLCLDVRAGAKGCIALSTKNQNSFFADYR